MDLIIGVDGIDLINDTPVAKRRQSLQIVENLVSGLKLLHSFNVAHQDIKLENIMYDKVAQRYKFIDFGYACILSDRITFFSQTLDNFPCGHGGTEAYMPPEMFVNMFYQAANRVYPATWIKAHDVWSLGRLFLEWYTEFSDTEFRKTLAFWPDLIDSKMKSLQQTIPISSAEGLTFGGIVSMNSLEPIDKLETILFQRDPQVRVDLFNLVEFPGTIPNSEPTWNDVDITSKCIENLQVWAEEHHVELEKEKINSQSARYNFRKV